VLAMIARNHRDFGFTAILVSHDIPDVFYISDRIALIEEGSIVFEGSPFEIKQSEHPVVRMFSRSLTELKDSLTDLQSRKDIEDHYQRAMVDGTFGDQPLTALLFTIKDLKQVDSRGSHLITQRIIQALSQFLDSHLESTAWSGRCEPDQILAILPRTDMEKAKVFLSTLSKDMKELTIFKTICRPSDHIFFSVGVRMIQGRPGMNFKSLIQTGWSDEQELAQLQCGIAEGLQ
jgi:phospholipid/cholesterol/gamma-HCH transport system ATP-binding protein